jgi:hypothetical protein
MPLELEGPPPLASGARAAVASEEGRLGSLPADLEASGARIPLWGAWIHLEAAALGVRVHNNPHLGSPSPPVALSAARLQASGLAQVQAVALARPLQAALVVVMAEALDLVLQQLPRPVDLAHPLLEGPSGSLRGTSTQEASVIRGLVVLLALTLHKREPSAPKPSNKPPSGLHSPPEEGSVPPPVASGVAEGDSELALLPGDSAKWVPSEAWVVALSLVLVIRPLKPLSPRRKPTEQRHA